MSHFITEFKRKGNLSFIGMRDTALSLLPTEKAKRDKLYQELERGKGILDDEDHLNMYLCSFGKMHQAKLYAAFETLPINEVFSEKVEVYDWGCGQGTAIICLLDYLRTKKMDSYISKITLVEPSMAAVGRASAVIECIDSTADVFVICKDFNNLSVSDFKKSNARKLHLFSNILDVEDFDLAQFIHLFQQQFKGENYFTCVGPYYSNNRRVDEFLAASCPEVVYATINKERGEWKNDWTISMRTFCKRFNDFETIENIRKRIEDSHKQDQFFAGYVLDAIAEEYGQSDKAKETEELYHVLSMFDVKSNITLGTHQIIDSKLAVLANIISRGLPTKAPVYVENVFSDIYKLSKKSESDSLIEYKSTHRINSKDIFEALHIVDPRFNDDLYNTDILESSFEYNLIFNSLKESEKEYLIQILEPQRSLSSIVELPDKKFSKDQRVDFAFEIPYKTGHTGFILELDGIPYHSNIFSRIRDKKRDSMATKNAWKTYRIKHLNSLSFINEWETDNVSKSYLSLLKKNYSKQLKGKWIEILEIVLSPIAIARIERMMVEAMISGILSIEAKEWNIVIVERDVPCAAIAIADFIDKYKHMCLLAGHNNALPTINFQIVSTSEFKDSPLHLGKKVLSDIPENHFDLCMDISVLLRENIDAIPLHVESDAVYLIRSSHRKKRTRTICTSENIQYPPFVKKNSSGLYINIPEREEILTYFLQEIFRKQSFRTGQLPILSRVLGDQTTIGLLPTGGGKSLIYQLSCILQPGVAIMVDPLMSLMFDQIRGLRHARIDLCECVNSGMTAQERAEKLNLLQNGSILFMLLSPERFLMKNFRASLQTMTERNHVYFSYGVIDEVHCVSEWGHDFRTSYLHLGRNMINLMQTKSQRPVSLIGLTATASFDVLADVERELTLGDNLSIDSETIVRPESDSRPELTYRIIEVRSNFDELKEEVDRNVLRKAESVWNLKDAVAAAKRNEMYTLFDRIPTDIESINQNESIDSHMAHVSGFDPLIFFEADESNKYNNAGIIFCPHAHGTFGVNDNVWKTRNGLSTELKAAKKELKIGTFIGGDHPSGDMRLFNENLQNVMIATKAFGMGIDKPNIRYSIHFNYPSSIEGYVQEAGRAGRDKKHAISYVLYDPTEYIELTIDKIHNIRESIGLGDPVWLNCYVNKFVLAKDLYDFCVKNGSTEQQANRIIDIIKQNNYLENVDKDINLWFHNDSFRGQYKEQVILQEFTERLLNVKPTVLTELQGKLRDVVGNEDVRLKLSSNNNGIILFSEENDGMQYGFIFLNTLLPSYRYANFDPATREPVVNSLIEILKNYKEHDPNNLLRPLDEEDSITEGIFQALTHAEEDGISYVVVSWENSIKQDYKTFENSIRKVISEISYQYGWHNLDEDRFGSLSLNKIESFDQLIAKISKCSGDPSWLTQHTNPDVYEKLKKSFYSKRDKTDTDKAIYRLCCIGIVEDVTIDYLSQTYELKLRRRTEYDLRNNMFRFFKKYCSTAQALKKVDDINEQSGKNFIEKCLNSLTSFVYEILEKKRYRAIEDMKTACADGVIPKWQFSEDKQFQKDKQIKEFIHLYFNSKYARNDYKVNGKPYSLNQDTTGENAKYGFDIVMKYMDVVNPNNDNSGSEIDNVKHLYGATLICLRSNTENPALKLLLTYCIAVLGTAGNDALKASAYNNYIEGFMSMYDPMDSKIWEHLDIFDRIIASKGKIDDDFIQEKIIGEGKKAITLLIHAKEVSTIAEKYLKK